MSPNARDLVSASGAPRPLSSALAAGSDCVDSAVALVGASRMASLEAGVRVHKEQVQLAMWAGLCVCAHRRKMGAWKEFPESV